MATPRTLFVSAVDRRMLRAHSEQRTPFSPLARGAMLAASLRPGWPGCADPALVRDPARLDALVPLWHQHGVAPLIWRRLRQSGLGDLAADGLGPAAMLSIVAVMVQQGALAAVVGRLRDRGVEPVLLKGLAVARHYEDASLRPGGDLDFWVRPRDLAAARAALQEAGYAQAYDIGIATPNPNTFVDPSDLQIDFKGWFKGISAALHRQWWARAIRAEIDGTEVRVLAPPDEVVYLSNHAARHSFRSAKWLVDIAMIVQRWDSAIWGPPELPPAEPARSWFLVALGLAIELLGADARRLPVDLVRLARRAARPWRRDVLVMWGGGTPEAGAVTFPEVREYLAEHRSPVKAWRLLRQLWPGPMEAAIYLQLPLEPAIARRARTAAFVRRRLLVPLRNVPIHASELRAQRIR